MSNDPKEIARLLAEPFPAEAVGWKPQTVKGNRALAVAYIDARDVIDRLNAVLGVAGWSDRFRETQHGVICTLQITIDNTTIEHEDFGNYSDQPDDGDKHKAAFSDALKRAAVKLGVGRYLYNLPKQWCDFDPVKKQFVKDPTLPPCALPTKPAPKPQNGQPEEVNEAVLRDWMERLERQPIKEINAALPELKDMNGPTKKAVFEELCRFLKGHYKFDQKQKQFVPEKEGATA